jgi:hypothetical protein
MRYFQLNAWDKAMQELDNKYKFMSSPHQWVTHIDEERKVRVRCMHDVMHIAWAHWRLGTVTAKQKLAGHASVTTPAAQKIGACMRLWQGPGSAAVTMTACLLKVVKDADHELLLIVVCVSGCCRFWLPNVVRLFLCSTGTLMTTTKG